MGAPIGIGKGISISSGSEEQAAQQALFPFGEKDKFKRLQSVTRYSNRVIPLITALGVIRRRFKSEILAMYQEELSVNRIAEDGKGRIELSEVYSSRVSKSADKDSD